MLQYWHILRKKGVFFYLSMLLNWLIESKLFFELLHSKRKIELH